MKLKIKTVLLKWFLSYIFILIIPILLSIGIYIYSLRITNEQSNKMNDSLMEMVKMEIDNHINEINKIFDRIALDSDVQSASNIKGRFMAKDQYLLYHLVNNLQNINLSDDFVEDIFIYFNNTGTVSGINGNMSDELFYHLYYENSDYDFYKFKELMGNKFVRDIIPIHKLNGENLLLFATTTLDSSIGENSGTIVITVNVRSLQKIVDTMKWDEDININIINSNNEIINNNEDSKWDMGLSYEKLLENEHFLKSIDGKKYVVSVNASENVDWKYICTTPNYLIERSARSIHYFSLAGLFFCIFAGSFFSFFLAKSNYNPLKGLMELFKGNETSNERLKADEYQWLREQVELFFKEHTDNKQALWHNRKILKDYYLFKLLEYSYDLKNGMKEYEKFGLKLNGKYNIVVLFAINEKDSKINYDAGYEENLDLYKFIIANIFEETAANHFNLEVTEIGDKVGAIINLPCNNLELLDILKESIYFVQQQVYDKFRFHTVALIGDIQKGLEGIHSSFAAANEAAEYITLLDTEIILFDDIKNLQRRYYYPIEMEEKIINALKAGDKRAAGNYIDDILGENYRGKNLSIGIWKCLLFDLMGTLMKGADVCGCDNIFYQMDISKQLSVRLSLEELKERFSALIELICEDMKEKQSENENNKQLSNKIIQYIMENYQDPDLNISLTGLHFSITPAYISSIFKKQTGESLLEFINEVRVKKARELLEQEVSVVETAQRVGFRNSGAFIRVFKKKTGITPGQMKKIT